MQGRYFYFESNGTNVNAGNHLVEVQIVDVNGMNRALGKGLLRYSNYNTYGQPPSSVTDGNTSGTLYFDFGEGKQYVVIDLGAVYEISYIKIWRYYVDRRVYNDVFVKVSTDDVNYETVFSSKVNGTYPEDPLGYKIDLPISEGFNGVVLKNQNQASTNSVTSCTLTMSGCTVGNTLILAYAVRGDGNDPTLTDGWTKLGGGNVDASAGDLYHKLYFAYKVVTSETETVTITQTVTSRIYMICSEYSGVVSVLMRDDLARMGNENYTVTGSKTNADDVMVYGVTSSYYASGRLQTVTPLDLVKIEGDSSAERLACWFDDGSGAVNHTFYTVPNQAEANCAILECVQLIGADEEDKPKKYYYNDVLLPEIPADVLIKCPYALIRITNSGYDLWVAEIPWYFNGTSFVLKQSAKNEKYICDDVNGWSFSAEYTDAGGVGLENGVLWSNYDIPSSETDNDKCYYNDVLLPKFPTEVLQNTSYQWIQLLNNGNEYRLVPSENKWFYNESTQQLDMNVACSYKVYTAKLNSTMWTESGSWTDMGGFSIYGGVIWSNVDIPKNSVDGNTIYFKGSEIVPVPVEIYFKGSEPVPEGSSEPETPSVVDGYITDSWEEIDAKCASGEYLTTYSLGDKKTITFTIDGVTETIDLEIIGFDHDDLSDGSGKASITFFSKQLLSTYRKMNASYSNSGGWAGSYSLRSWCNTDLFNALPSDLQAVIQSVKKLSDGGQGSTSLVETNDKVWFGSMDELSWHNSNIVTVANQGTRYELCYGTDTMTADQWRAKATNDGTVRHWWLRTACTDSAKWAFMATWASPSYDQSANDFYIAFGLCVGKTVEKPLVNRPLIDVSMTDGNNIGTGGETYNSTFSGGSFQNKKYVLNGKGYLTVPVPFMSGTGKWTVAFKIDAWTSAGNSYARFARGNNDVPSLFYSRTYSSVQGKLAYGSANTNTVTVLDSTCTSVDSAGAILMNIPRNESTLFVFRNDGENITLWINGIKTLQEDASRYTSDKYASTFSIGDDAGGSYYMSHLECSLLKLWDDALSDEEIPFVESGINEEPDNPDEPEVPTVDKYSYNGVLLPKIPSDVLESYPYCWIRNNTTTGHYDLIFSTEPWYYNSGVHPANNTLTLPWYRIEIGAINTATEWTFNKDAIDTYFGIDTARTVLWSNHDIPNGSATATTMYFAGSDAIKSDYEPYLISTLEAETGILSGSAVIDDRASTSGNIVVDGITNSNGSLTMNFKTYFTGYYLIRMYFTHNGTREFSYTINGKKYIASIVGTSYNTIESVDFQMYLKKGTNNVVFAGGSTSYAPMFDKFELYGLKAFTLYEKYLVKSNDTIYTISGETLTPVDTSGLVSDVFKSYGVDEIPNASIIKTLQNPEILYWTNDEEVAPVVAIVKAVPIAQTLVSKDYMFNIKYTKCKASTDVLFAVSFNSGNTWLGYSNGSWTTVQNPTMTADVLNAITSEQWGRVSNTGKFRFKVLIPKNTSYLGALSVEYL